MMYERKRVTCKHGKPLKAGVQPEWEDISKPRMWGVSSGEAVKKLAIVDVGVSVVLGNFEYRRKY